MSQETLDDDDLQQSTPDTKRTSRDQSGQIPPDYEKLLSTRKDELRQEEFPNLLLFPQQDVIAKAEPWDYRTVISTVPEKALDLPTTLFTHECLKFYSSQWERVTYNFAKYGGSYALLLDEEAREALPHLTFERDQQEAEAFKEESDGSAKQLSKSGYLSRGPFPGDQSTSSAITAKSYRKHWFDLRVSTQVHGGSYTFAYYGDDKSSIVKGKIPVEIITEIKKNSKHKQYGFDLLTEDDRTVYPLSADSERDMEDWIDTLKKAFGLENEAEQTVKPIYSTDTLRDTTKRSLLRPELLHYSEGSTDNENRINRQTEQNDIFLMYPELLHQPPPEAEEGPGPIPKENFGIQIHVICQSLFLKLSMTKSGISQLLEPFFIKMALYDAQKGIKISEDFNVDLNEFNIRSLLPKRKKLVRVGLDYEEVDYDEVDDTTDDTDTIEQFVNTVQQAIFSVLFPNTDIYLVARIEKVLHGGIQQCAEPYQRTGDTTKVIDKLSKQMGGVCSRLGAYRMPFAWCARPVFGSGNIIDESNEFSPLYRQDRERLMDDDLLKYLIDFRNIGRYKLPIIAGNLIVTVQQFRGHTGMILTPSYLPLKPATQQSSNGTAAAMIPTIKEIRSFTPYRLYEPHTHYDPYLSLIHNLYVYPLSLNYEAQKQFTKARNIAIKIEFKESDYSDTAPLNVIYSRSVGEAFSTKAVSHVLYHSQSPTFYEEIKIKLPIRLSRRHHVLVTFLHVSCELPKSSKSTKGSTRQPAVETVVGYTWIPLLETDGKIINNIQSLPVATTLPPGYLSTLRGDLKKPDLPTPNIQWVDSAKLIFKVRLQLDSTIYTEDAELFTFFAVCDHVQRGKSVPLVDLRFAVESLIDCDLLSLFHGPVLFHMLLRLLCFSQEPVPLIKLEIMKVLVSFINKLVSVERQDILKSYIEYMFVTEVDPITGQSIHDELVALLIEYLDETAKNKDSFKFLNFVSFFLDIILKSMAQFLGQIGKENASRKSRYPDELGNNLCALTEKLIPRIIMCYVHPTGPRANVGLATFLKHSFSFMDRGVVFNIIRKCLDEFDKHNKEEIVLMKCDFISILCEHEHFIPLNLPFKQNTADVLYELNNDYCDRHFLASILLKEVEKALSSSSTTVRQKGISILRNLFAKLDSDERFTTPVQKERIATLFFPIIPLTIQNFHRLQRTSSNINKKPTSLQLEPQSPSPSNFDEDSMILSSSGGVTGGRTGPKRSLISDFNTASMNPPKSPAGSDVDASVTTSTHGKLKHSMTGLSNQSISKLKDYNSDTLDVTSVREEMDEKDEEEVGLLGGGSLFGLEETRDILICFLFILNHIEQRVIEHWWVMCVDKAANSRVYSWSTDINPITNNIGSEIEIFFDLLELCVRVFEYSGRRSITKKWSARTTMLKQLEQSYSSANMKTKAGGGGGGGGGRVARRSFAAGLSSNKSRLSRITSSSSFLSPAQIQSPLGLGSDDMELYIRTEGNLANEVGMIVLETLELFMDKFKILLQDSVDNQINGKIVCVLSSLLDTYQSTTLLKHVFASLKSYVHKFSSVLFRGNPEHCGSICYQLLLCCNSQISSTKAEASALLYLLMRCNYEYFNKKQGFVRTDLQMTKSLSKIATMDLPRSYSNLRRSLGVIVTYADNDSRVQSGSFPIEIRDLMIRLRTVLSSTAQMKEHRSDPEKLLDLQYSLANSYAHSPELRHTWLESMALLHIEHKNYTEAAQCYLHIAGLVAEYMKVAGKYTSGSKSLRNLSKNVEKEESGIKMEKGASREQRYSEVDLVTFLESSMSLLEQSELYELTTSVFQLLLPYYQEQKNYKKLTEMYGRLYDCHKKIVSTMETGKRYLGTYFRIAFYGDLFGEDHKKQFVYREPKVTGLAEITQRLIKLYSRKFGPEIVQVIHEAGKVDSDSLDKDKAYIQITHVQPYFTEEELQERTTKFEREHSLSKFVFEVPFTPTGEARGGVENQHMRKTLLITSHWFPYIVKRIPVVRDESWEITPIEVAVEAMSKIRDDLLLEVSKKKHDLVKLQLLLQGSLSPQVNQGALEYANVFLKPTGKFPHKFTDQLKTVYSSFMQLCEVALTIHGQLISEEQLLLHEDMLQKFQLMSQHLEKIISQSQKMFSSRITSPKKTPLRQLSTTVHPTL